MPRREQASVLIPDWSFPAGVHCCVTTRYGGVSTGRYATFNLAVHVGDSGDAVAENRRRLIAAQCLPAPPLWLNQVHGAAVIEAPVRCPEPATDTATATEPAADGAVTSRPGIVCAVLTADCVPVLLAAGDGSRVAALHAGWRGLCGGIIEAGVAAMGSPGGCRAWIGPAISAAWYQIGPDVREALVGHAPGWADRLSATSGGRWLADLPGMACDLLRELGVRSVTLSQLCSYSDRRFYSHRRDGVTGRTASLIWRDDTAR